MSGEYINESIQYARELALDLKYQAKDRNKPEVLSAVRAMNEHLFRPADGGLPPKRDYSTWLRAKQAFIDLPPAIENVEFLELLPLEQSKIEQALIHGEIESFRWLGSVGISLFGIQLSYVNIVQPRNLTPDNTFVPLLALE